MHIELTAYEARVIGCLIEKQIATPEHYPLSLNALTNAVNQKSNRDPELALDDATVQGVVDSLVRKSLVSEHSGFGSRVAKFQHRFCNTEYGQLRFSKQELAIVCELLLRGPQTPGELRSRAGRLAPFADAGDAQAALDALQQRTDGPFVVRLVREPGRREARYAHLFSGEVAGSDDGADRDADDAAGSGLTTASADGARAGAIRRIAELEARVGALEAQISAMRELLESLTR